MRGVVRPSIFAFFNICTSLKKLLLITQPTLMDVSIAKNTPQPILKAVIKLDCFIHGHMDCSMPFEF
jgi:hypothetical protein